MGTLTSVKVWKGLNKKVIGRCNLCSTKQGDLKKIMKSCIPKCRRWATLKVGNLKASEQPQDGLMRHLSPRTQSFPLVVTWHGLRRSFHQLVRCNWTKALTLPGYQQRGSATEAHIYQMQCGPNWTSNARCRGKAKHGRNPRGLSRPFGRSNHVEVTLSSAKTTTNKGPSGSSSTRIRQLAVRWHHLHAVQPPYY